MENENTKKIEEQKTFLFNRLIKRNKHLGKWARRNNISCYRVYDKDIPEIPLAIDFYKNYISLSLYERPYEKSEDEEELWISEMVKTISSALNVPQENIFTKTRKKQKGTSQYEKNETEKNFFIKITENNHTFKINPSQYLDTGLFLDHRPLRKIVESEAKDKTVLNLFCYTGAFSVYAACGGAKKVTSVDLSNTYLEWAKDNFALNNLDVKNDSTKKPIYEFIRENVLFFLDNSIKEKKQWDIIVLDPPTFSNSKKMEGFLDINRDWAMLVSKCLLLLNTDGTLYFSTNSRRLKMDETLIEKELKKLAETSPKKALLAKTSFADTFFAQTNVSDITSISIPEDFKNTKIHRAWKITKKNETNDCNL